MSYRLFPRGLRDAPSSLLVLPALALSLVSSTCLASEVHVASSDRVFIPHEPSAHSSMGSLANGLNAPDRPARVLMTCPLSAEAVQTGKLPLHPTSILGTLNETVAPVAGMKGDKVQVLLGSKQISLKQNAAFDLVRAQAYAPGEVSVLQKSLIYHYKKETMLPHTEVRVGASVVVEYQPSQDIQDCYAAVLVVGEDYLKGLSNELQIAIRFDYLGDLKAGKKSEFQVWLGEGVPWTGIYAIPLFFQKGAELRSNEAEIIAAFFNRVKQTRSTAQLAKAN